MGTTRITQHINAPRADVYRTLLDGSALARWKVPDGMTCEVHQFDAKVGGRIRVTLTYSESAASGKTNAHSDTYHGRFTELVPNERIVEVDEFETSKADMQGEMTITIALAEHDGGTMLTAVHDNLPSGVSERDNETGWKMAVTKLAALVESES